MASQKAPTSIIEHWFVILKEPIFLLWYLFQEDWAVPEPEIQSRSSFPLLPIIYKPICIFTYVVQLYTTWNEVNNFVSFLTYCSYYILNLQMLQRAWSCTETIFISTVKIFIDLFLADSIDIAWKKIHLIRMSLFTYHNWIIDNWFPMSNIWILFLRLLIVCLPWV